MKKLGISQRVEVVAHYQETRDCLDQRWSDLGRAIGSIVIPLPNLATANARDYLDALALDGFILSGGNSIVSIEPEATGTSATRDSFEGAILEYALAADLPVVGVCRGMQLMNLHFGGNLTRVEGHVATRHHLERSAPDFTFPDTVNSYHNWSVPIHGLADQLMPLAFDQSGNVEAFIHRARKLLGIMWHPEREEIFDPLDLQLLVEHFS